MNIKLRNTLGEIIGASIAMIWMCYSLTESSIMTIESISKVLAKGIGISIIIIIAITFSGFVASIVNLFFKIYLYR